MYIVLIGGFVISMFIELTVASLLLFVCGIAALLRAIGILVIWPLRTVTHRTLPSGNDGYEFQPLRESMAHDRWCDRGWPVMKTRVAWIRTVAPSLAGCLLAFTCLLMLPRIVFTQQTTSPPAPDKGFTINVSVDEVVLHATVRDKHGNPVPGLGKENFQVFEDKVYQPIKYFSHDDIPVTIGLVIDNSGSMQAKRAEVIAAALAFAGSSNPLDQVFLVNFNEHVTFGLPANIEFTDQPDQIKSLLRTVKADGKTALYDAVAIAIQHLKKGNRDKKVLIIVSDGADNASTHTKEQIQSLATKSDAIIYALGIYEEDDPENRHPEVLTDLAKASGGEAFFPQEIRNVLPLCERIAHEIRTQYTVAYISTNQQRDGAYRNIQMRAAMPTGKGLAVTTRVGYFAPSRPVAKPAASTGDASKPDARN